MGIQTSKSTRRQELIGRAAMVIGGIVMGLGGIGLGYLGIKFGSGMAETGGTGTAVQYCWLLFILAAFLEILALIFIVFAVLPDREARRGPPRGFVLVSGVFDVFWKIVGEIMRLLSRT
jgi:CBS domain containing-hemolysin-like protein